MTALNESVRFGVEKQRQLAIAALKKDDLATFAEILGELRTTQLSAENAIADLQDRFTKYRTPYHKQNEGAPTPVEIPNRDGHPDAVPA